MFSKRLKMLRERHSMSMDRLVELYNKKYSAKMNKSTLSRYENGLQDPIYTQVVNLADFFGVSIDYITCNSDNENKPGEAELEEDVIMYHRDGRTVRKKMSKETKAAITAMLDTLPDDNDPDL